LNELPHLPHPYFLLPNNSTSDLVEFFYLTITYILAVIEMALMLDLDSFQNLLQ